MIHTPTVPSVTPTIESPRRKFLSGLIEFIQVIAISAAIVIPLRTFLVQPFYVKGASMEPNFYDHEYLFIDKWTYRREPINRGDIIVFRYPRNPSEYFIKRVIALPDETIELNNGVIKVYNKEHEQGFVLDEKEYLVQDFTAGTDTRTLKDKEYYLLGDNRAMSLDSRAFGPVHRSSIVGRVWVRAYPFESWMRFSPINYPNP